MQLVPVPTTPDYLTATRQYWAPFLPDIARRSPWSEAELVRKLLDNEVQAVLVIDGPRDGGERHAVALLGVSICDDTDGISPRERPSALVGELVWLTGKQRQAWQHLLPELERYLREHVHCVKCRPICRPGWRPFLVAQGYTFKRVTPDKHIVMEKVL